MNTLPAFVKNLTFHLATQLVANHQYGPHWEDKFRLSEIDDAVARGIKSNDGKRITQADIDECGFKDLLEARFAPWNLEGDDGLVLMLVPLFLLPYLDGDIKLDDISITTKGVYGHKPTLVKDVDDDHRGGYLAYGVLRQRQAIDDKEDDEFTIAVIHSPTSTSLHDSHARRYLTLKAMGGALIAMMKQKGLPKPGKSKTNKENRHDT